MNLIGDQLLNLSIQLLNTGIQTFNTGKIFSQNYNEFFDKLQEISGKINDMINSHNMEKMQQQMMQQMMQQQVMQQQMMQQQIMQQQVMQQQIMQQKIIDSFRINIVFKGNSKTFFCLAVRPIMTIKELCDKFRETFYMKYNNFKNRNFYLLYKASNIETDSLRTIKDYFCLENLNYSSNYIFEITVVIL